MPAAMIRALTELGVAGALTGLVVSTGSRVRYHRRAGWEQDVPRRIMAFAARAKCRGLRVGLPRRQLVRPRANAMIELLACLSLASQDQINGDGTRKTAFRHGWHSRHSWRISIGRRDARARRLRPGPSFGGSEKCR